MKNVNQQQVNTETTTQNNTTNQQMRFPLVLGSILLLLLVGVGAYYLGTQKNGESSDTQPIPTSISSSTTIQEASPTAFEKMSSPPDIEKEITTTQLKSIPLTSTDSWKDVAFKGIAFKIPLDLTFKDLQDSSNIAIIYKEGELSGPRANIGVEVYKGGSRRQEYFGDNYYDCHYIYEEALFGAIKALQIAADLNWCQGGAGAIVAIIGNKLVWVGSLQYDVQTEQIFRFPLRDTIVSTLKLTQ